MTPSPSSHFLIDTTPTTILASFAQRLPESIYTCWPVITEACYLLRRHPDLVESLLEACHERVYELLPLTSQDIPEIGGTLAKYRDQQIDIVHLANREQIEVVMTIDHRHFSLFRTSAGKPLTLIPDNNN